MHATSDPIEAFGAYRAAVILTSKFTEQEELDLGPPLRHLALVPGAAQALTGSVETSPLRIEDEDQRPPERAFERLDEKWEEEFRELLNYTRTSLERPDRDRLASRIEYLATRLDDELDFVPVSPVSLRGLISLFQTRPLLRYPDIAVTPAGNLRAHWRASGGRYAAFEFLPSGEVRFLLHFPNPRRSGRLIKEYGITTADYLLDRAELCWVAK